MSILKDIVSIVAGLLGVRRGPKVEPIVVPIRKKARPPVPPKPKG